MRPRRRRPGRHKCRRIVLHPAATEPEARQWAIAARSVLRELGIADWWRVDVGEAGGGGWLVAVDYKSTVRGQP